MAEMKKNNIFEDGTASKDEPLELEKLLANMKTSSDLQAKEVKQQAVNTPVQEKELSPLEKLKKEKEKEANQGGIVVSNEELEQGKIKSPNKNIVYNNDRMNSIQEAIDSFIPSYPNNY